MHALRLDQADAAAGVAERQQLLAHHLQALRGTIRLRQFLRKQHRQPEAAEQFFIPVSEAALLSAFTSKRLVFRPAVMTDPAGRARMEKAADQMVKNGMLEKPIGPDLYAN